jgi:hypothetical protein
MAATKTGNRCSIPWPRIALGEKNARMDVKFRSGARSSKLPGSAHPAHTIDSITHFCKNVHRNFSGGFAEKLPRFFRKISEKLLHLLQKFAIIN